MERKITNKTYSFKTIEDITLNLEPEMLDDFVDDFVDDFKMFLSQILVLKVACSLDENSKDLFVSQMKGIELKWNDDGIREGRTEIADIETGETIAKFTVSKKED